MDSEQSFKMARALCKQTFLSICDRLLDRITVTQAPVTFADIGPEIRAIHVFLCILSCHSSRSSRNLEQTPRAVGHLRPGADAFCRDSVDDSPHCGSASLSLSRDACHIVFCLYCHLPKKSRTAHAVREVYIKQCDVPRRRHWLRVYSAVSTSRLTVSSSILSLASLRIWLDFNGAEEYEACTLAAVYNPLVNNVYCYTIGFLAVRPAVCICPGRQIHTVDKRINLLVSDSLWYSPNSPIQHYLREFSYFKCKYSDSFQCLNNSAPVFPASQDCGIKFFRYIGRVT